jgi:hypothetical protein
MDLLGARSSGLLPYFPNSCSAAHKTCTQKTACLVSKQLCYCISSLIVIKKWEIEKTKSQHSDITKVTRSRVLIKLGCLKEKMCTWNYTFDGNTSSQMTTVEGRLGIME